MKSRNYVEFEVFTNFRGLEEKKFAALMRKADRRDVVLTSSEDITPLLAKLDELAATYTEARNQLEYEKVELANGAELYAFYAQMAGKLNDIRRKLK